MGLTEGEDTHSRSIFGQIQTVIKSELIGILIRGKRVPPRIVFIVAFPLVLSVSIHRDRKQNNLAECKPRIEMGKWREMVREY